MSNITLYVPEEVKSEIDRHDEIRWSEVVRKSILEKLRELKKLELLKKYVEKQPFSEEDWKWMDENDWHPVDEKELKLSFVEEIKKRSKEKPVRIKKVEDLLK